MTYFFPVRQSKMTGRRVALLAALVFAVPSLLSGYLPSLPARADAITGRFYPQTQHTLAPQFVAYYDSHGGIPLFGYPITEPAVENGHLVQWTERERLEWHPEHVATPYEVQLGLLGSELTRGLSGPHFKPLTPPGTPPGSTVYFSQTRQSVSDPFLTYWRQNGGVDVFGYPVSARYTDTDGIDVQWFERARFEYHPELPDPFKVSLGLVGIEGLHDSQAAQYEVQVSGAPAPDPSLEVGLAQGGESPDPGFFDNVVQPGKALGPGLVRLDNIYDYYHVVSRSDTGQIVYNWSELDRIVDAVRAMGKEPLICLSYMPEVFSVSGSSRVEPPSDFTDWGALVHATVLHLNVERNLHIRYFEVWNEPNQWDFWKGSYDDYLRLYDTTVQAALSADPSVQIGGPALSIYDANALGKFLQHEASIPGGRADFVSWHAYGTTPDNLAEQIRGARALVAQFPNLHSQLFVTEFNVLQGGPGDTSAHGYTDRVQGAIEMLRSIESMQRERLDKAFLFELKDGKGPKDYWGRWGILTNSGQPKPIYYVLQSYLSRPAGMLPTSITKGPTDGSIGVMAYGSGSASTLFLWYTGTDPGRIKISLPSPFANAGFTATLFDDTHNNPAASGAGPLKQDGPYSAGDLVFTLAPNSLVILTSQAR